MSRLPQNIRAALLSSGKDQFLAYGFEKASLRTICKKAGLTTQCHSVKDDTECRVSRK